jgi:hypothetical protein
MIEILYGVNAQDSEQIKIHSDAVVDIIINALFIETPVAVERVEDAVS